MIGTCDSAGPGARAGESRSPWASLSVRKTWAIGCAVLLLAAAHTAVAGDRVWIRHGPEGGAILALAVDPMRPSTLYAGTKAGALKSTDGGGV